MSEPECSEGHEERLAGVTVGGFPPEATEAPATVYELVGGQGFFDNLVDRFYNAVEADLVLRPLYPEDLGPSRARLAGFLAQYWGGPPLYSQMRGHPRLRLRHMPFAIGWAEREAWMRHMTAALDAARVADCSGRRLPTEIRALMFDHFDNAATFLVNRGD